MKKIAITLLIGLTSIVGMSQKIQSDKISHFMAGGLITSSTYIGLNRFKLKETNKIFISVGMGLLAGVGKEVWDKQRGGKFDGKDILATGLGSISVTIPIGIGNLKPKQ